MVLRPNDPVGWYNLGVSYDFAAKFDDALRAYGQAEKLKPDNPAVKNNIGRIYYKRSKLDEADSECRAALTLDDNFVDARYNLALILTAAGGSQDPNKIDKDKLEEANTEWQKLIEYAAREDGQADPRGRAKRNEVAARGGPRRPGRELSKGREVPRGARRISPPARHPARQHAPP